MYHDGGIRGVAEQIEGLYTGAAEAGASAEDRHVMARKTDDLTNDKVIAQLTEDFSQHEEYLSGITKLRALSERRKQAKRKLQRYRALQTQLAFLKDPQTSIQPNLATRDGPLAQELLKSRALANRVEGRVAGTKRSRQADDEQDQDQDAFLLMEDQEKVKSVLEIH